MSAMRIPYFPNSYIGVTIRLINHLSNLQILKNISGIFAFDFKTAFNSIDFIFLPQGKNTVSVKNLV